MVQKSGMKTSWGVGGWNPIIYNGFFTSQVVFSPDFWTINGSTFSDSHQKVPGSRGFFEMVLKLKD